MIVSRTTTGRPHTVSIPARADDDVLPVVCVDALGTAVPGMPGATTLANGRHSVIIPSIAAPDVLSLTLGVAPDLRYVETVEVVERRYASLDMVREAAAGSLGSQSDWRLDEALTQAEHTIEQICAQAFCRQVLVFEGRTDTMGNLWPPVDVRTIRGARDQAGDTVAVSTLRVARRAISGFSAGADGTQWVRVVVEHGVTAAPAEITDAAARLARHRAHQLASAIPDRAERWQVIEGGALVSLAMPGPGRTGLPEVDAILARYRAPGIA